MGEGHPGGHDVDGLHVVEAKHPANHFGFICLDDALLVANGGHELDFSLVGDGILPTGHEGLGDALQQPDNGSKHPGQGSDGNCYGQGNGDGIALAQGFWAEFPPAKLREKSERQKTAPAGHPQTPGRQCHQW